MRFLLPAVLTFAFLAGCASLSREECELGDWETIGRNDGAAGFDTSSRFALHLRACARADVTPDRTEWLRGYNQGLTQYCTPQGGLEAGAAGRIYRNVCPDSTEPAFLEAYRFGERAHRKRQEIARVEAEIISLQSRNRQLANQDDPSSRSERAFAQLDLLNLDMRLVRLRAELRQIEREIESYRRSLG